MTTSVSQRRLFATDRDTVCNEYISTRYLGSKQRLAAQIVELAGHPDTESTFVDLFAGTGVVARAAASRGWDVRINDHLTSASVTATANSLSRMDVAFEQLGGYRSVILTLNGIDPERGYIWRNYSPASELHGEVPRKYFTEENAGRVDAIRSRIRDWRNAGAISEYEERLLVADLLDAANRVANTAGTYGCFLSHWSSAATQILELTERCLLSESRLVGATNLDASSVDVRESDVLYLDPPYTKRQYAAYYHVLETIAVGDQPKVEGVTGLRPWREKASDFCYKRRALKAFQSVFEGLRAKRFLVSYSSQGHVWLEDLVDLATEIGEVQVHELGEIGRYRSNRAASAAGSTVTEYLVEIRRSGS